MNENNDIIENGSLLIENDCLTYIGPIRESDQGFSGMIIDATEHLVMPGLINAHTHLPMSLFRGMADDLPLMVWLNEYVFPAEARFIDPGTVSLGTRLSCAELLLSGTTCCCDGYFLESCVSEAVLESGLRGILGQGIIDYPAPGVPDPSQNVDHALFFVKDLKGRDSCVTPSIFCHSPYTCSETTLIRAKQAAMDEGVIFQIHVAETRAEWEQIRNEKGMSPVLYLDRLGLLDKNTLLIHGVHMDNRDLEVIAGRGAALIHAPESNMKLASGIAPVPACLDLGIRVGLGTDGSASNNNLDMFSEMDTAAKLHKVNRNDPTVMDALTVLSMATCKGAAAIGLKDVIGSLEVGKCADVIVVDINKPHLVPMYNPFSHLVYAASGADVRHVIVNGRLVVENRCLLSMDLEDLMIEAKKFGKFVKKTMM